MQFFLANPAWLWLLSLAVVPLLVHLFARSNPPKYAFSSVEFLRRILKKTARLRKPQDWLLLLLRTLAVLALLFIFLQPFLTGKTRLAGGKKTTVYLIDRSASMACKDGASSRFDTACAKAIELMEARSGHEANVIWIDAEPDAVFPQPGQNTDFLQDSLKRAEVHPESGAISAALSFALSQLNQAEGARELVVISDFQATSWKDFPLQVDKGVDLVKVKVGQGDTENLAVSELLASPANPVVGQDVLMVCRLHNFSATPRRTTLYLESGGGRQSRELEIPAWGEAEANFETRFAQPGQVQVSASIGEDAFTGDNVRHALIEVRQTLKIVSVAPAKNDAPEVLARLAASLDWLDHRVLPAGELPNPGTADFLFLHAWDGQNLAELEKISASGTTLIVDPAPGISMADCEKLLALQVTRGNSAIAVDTKGAFKAGISAKAGDNKIFALFKSGEFGNPAAGTFKERLHLPAEWPDSVTRLIDYQDGVPGLLSADRDRTPVILWNLPLANSLSSWAGQSAFVPFMGELLLNSRAREKSAIVDVLPGSPLVWLPGEGISLESVALINEAGETLETETRLTDLGAQLTSKTMADPGVYQWKIGDGVAHQQVSNFPPTESDLRLLDPSQIQGGEVLDSQQLLRRAALGEGVPLWSYFVAAVLIFLILEALLAGWKPKSNTTVPGVSPKIKPRTHEM